MKIGVAMSGGLDSATAALVLKKQGHEVIGLHAHLHEYSKASWLQAQHVAQEIGVPIYLINMAPPFKKMVIEPFIEAYANGRTPSPCLICNRDIKMGLLFDHARSLGCEKIATGHYARLVQKLGATVMARGADAAKDQSYFLAMLPRAMLNRPLFPLGDFTKEQSRRFLAQEGVTAWQSDESQELCFMPHENYKEFLFKQGVKQKTGSIVDCLGRCLGKHSGVIGYTVGQRKGLGISSDRPLYVVRIEADTQTIVVGFREQTLVSSFRINNFNLIWPVEPIDGQQFQVKVRSTSQPVQCLLENISGTSLTLRLSRPQSGVAPGQAAVLYHDDYVIGAGWISG